MDTVFSLRNVRKTRPGDDGFRLLVERLDVPRGSLLALVGPSGCGKSTALDMLACALSPDPSPKDVGLPITGMDGKDGAAKTAYEDAQGSIHEPVQGPVRGDAQGPACGPVRKDVPGNAAGGVDGMDGTTAGEYAPGPSRFVFTPTPGAPADVLAAWRGGGTDALALLRLRHMGYVLQTGGLLPFLTARENIALRCRTLGNLAQRQEAMTTVVNRLGIGPLLGHYPATLSVGERQRVAIAAALAHGPSVVLADEPTAALDPGHAANVLRLLGELALQLRITVIMVTHNLEQAREAGFSPARVHMRTDAAGSLSCLAWPGSEA